jgi:hypothetical protein
MHLRIISEPILKSSLKKRIRNIHVMKYRVIEKMAITNFIKIKGYVIQRDENRTPEKLCYFDLILK